MNREDIIRMAREAGDADRIDPFTKDGDWVILTPDELERFAALVAKHTLANIDPSSFMSWQEGYEAGKQTEREACADIADRLPRIYRETEQAHYRLSPEPFKPSQFGFDFAELRQAEAITQAIRARNTQ